MKKRGEVSVKKVLSLFITLVVLFSINYFIAKFFQVSIVDFSFLVGLMGIVIIKFFGSSGGYSSRVLDMQIQSRTGIKQEQTNHAYQPSIPFYTAISYTLISAIVTLFYYSEYFIG
jgi:hypothetical protein